MSNSALAVYTKLSPNFSDRTEEITKITPHHMSGNLSIETCGAVFAPTARKASSNYGIGSDGRVGMYVPEDKRAWTSSSKWNDQRAVTIEVANSECKAPWPVSEKAWNALVDLCVDIVKRNPGIKRADGKTPGLNYTGDKYGSLTKHKMFAATDCPGSYLDNKMKELELAVNARLDGGAAPAATPTPNAAPAATVAFAPGWYQVTASSLNVRSNAGTGNPVSASAKPKGTKVNVHETKLDGSDTWGRIDGGWIAMKYQGSTYVAASSAPAPVQSFPNGTYTLTGDGMRVRTGPGSGCRVKSFSELTANAKQHAYANGTLKKGTRVTVSQTSGTDDVWGLIPSGWVALRNGGKTYAERV